MYFKSHPLFSTSIAKHLTNAGGNGDIVIQMHLHQKEMGLNGVAPASLLKGEA